MGELGEVINGFSGLKGRLLLFGGVVALAGMAWGAGRALFNGAESSSRPAPMQAEMRIEGEQGPVRGEDFLWKADRWSEGAAGLGASFIVAMLVGSMLRAAIRTGATLIALAGIAVWFLESRGHVSLWEDYSHTVQEGGTWIAARTEILLAFLKAHLPSSFAAAAGFGFGLRK